MLPLSKDRADQCGFSCPIGADQRCDLPAVDMKIDVPQDILPIDLHPKVLNFQTAVAAAALSLMLHNTHFSPAFNALIFASIMDS